LGIVKSEIADCIFHPCSVRLYVSTLAFHEIHHGACFVQHISAGTEHGGDAMVKQEFMDAAPRRRRRR
jgi:hypothetical protein